MDKFKEIKYISLEKVKLTSEKVNIEYKNAFKKLAEIESVKPK